jgi:hypothetical protein
MTTCPHCHSVERFGARMTRLKAAIIDHVQRAGDIGATSLEIMADLYCDRRSVSLTTIKAHIWQINELLDAGDWQIRSDGRRWFLRRRKSAGTLTSGD